MSYHDAKDPVCTAKSGAIALTIEPREKDLGEFSVRRVLPSRARRMVGPFVFFDHMGPAEFPPGKGIAVRPHPHIGIATITYLFEGEIIHRDSLGINQPIQSGAVNLMTAGRGIVHSERAGDDLHMNSRLHGIQSWLALPTGQEEIEPAFSHYAADKLPQLELDGVTVRVIMGSAFEATSPVESCCPTLYLDCRMAAGSTLALPDSYAELAAYVVAGRIQIGQQEFARGVMAVACAGESLLVRATSDCHLMVIGGDGIGKRHIWWNFVSSSRERIEQAKADWLAQRFEAVPGDEEFIPLPRL